MDTENERAHIQALYTQMMEGWNEGSAEAFAAPLTEDADFIAFDGSYFNGKRELIAAQQPLFDKWLKGTRLVGEVQTVRFLAPDIAVLHAIGGTIMQNQSQPAPERESIQTLIAVKRDNRWQLTAFQNTRVRPMGQSGGTAFAWLVADWLWNRFRPKK